MTETLSDVDLKSIEASLKGATSYTSTSLHDAVKLRLGKQGLLAIKPQTIPQFFKENCEKYAQHAALAYEVATNTESSANKSGSQDSAVEGTWITVTYAEYAKKVHQAALMLLHVGLQPRSSIGILAFNCPEWFYAEFGALRAGGVVAGIYPSNSAEAVFHVLDSSDATVCVVDDAKQMAKVRAVKSRLPRLRAILQLNGPYDDFVGNEEGYYRWCDLAAMKFGDDLHEELERRERNIFANECAMLIYTSGTVGMPKAVMLSHDGIVFDTKTTGERMKHRKNGAERTVTYLPLNHIVAQVFDIYMSILGGGCIYFADPNALKGTLGRTLANAIPTHFFGVPRVYEKIQEKLNVVNANSSSLVKYITDKSREVVTDYHMDVMQGKTPSTLKYWLASRVMRQIKYALGMNNCVSCFVGGAPISEELIHYFLGLDMPLINLYGLSETSGAVSIPDELRNLESVGKALDGVEFKIFNPDGNGHGEICIRGRTTFMGYLNDAENTKEAIKEDGWFYSGDIGYLDLEGNLVISGRIKEIIITAGGENIPPARIEYLIKNELPGIGNAMLVGDRRKYLTVLLTIKTDSDTNTGYPLDKLHPEAIDWMHSLDLEFTKLSEVLNIPKDIKNLDASNVEVQPHAKVVKAIEEGITRANTHAISNAQRVQKFALLPHDFSIPTGELGPTLKMRRNIVLQKYAHVIEQMYK